MLSHLMNVQEKPVRLLRRLLRLMDVPVTGRTIHNVLLNHPDYPSLLSLSDALRGWGVNNAAMQINKDDLPRLPLPFLAHIRRNDAESFALVTAAGKAGVQIISDEGKIETVPLPQFANEWSGVALLVEKGECAGEKEYTANRRKEQAQQVKLPAFLAGALGVVAAAAFFFYRQLTGAEVTGYVGLGLYTLCGVALTALLLWYEVDRANLALQKICTAGANTNCNAVLQSKGAKLFAGISWSETGFFYFAAGYASLVVAGFAGSASILYLVAWLTAAALPYTLFSFYYQWRVVKQWCPLCIAVQGVLLSGFAVALSTGLLCEAVSHVPTFAAIALYGGAVLLAAVAWYGVKPLLLQGEEAKRTRRELAQLKANRQIWEALLAKQKRVEHKADGLGILIGSPNAAHTLIKVCNPYCGPCAKAHPEIEKLLEKNDDLKVQILFTATADENDRKLPPVTHLLAVAERNNETLIKQALDDWYLPEKKDYPAFAAKYPMNGELKKQNRKIEAMQRWCKETDIQFYSNLFY